MIMWKRVVYLCMAPLLVLMCILLSVTTESAVQLFCSKVFGMTYLETRPIALMFAHISYVLVFGLWYGVGLKKFCNWKKSVKCISRPRNILGIVLIGFADTFVVVFGLVLIEAYLPREIMERYKELSETAQLGESLISQLTANFIAPFGEELIFRGVMLCLLLRAFKGLKHEKALFWVANVMQAVAFGVFHGNVYQFMYTSLSGLLYGYLVYKSGTLLVSIVMHMINNVWTVWFMESIAESVPATVAAYTWVVVISAVVLIVGLFIVKFPKEESGMGAVTINANRIQKE